MSDKEDDKKNNDTNKEIKQDLLDNSIFKQDVNKSANQKKKKKENKKGKGIDFMEYAKNNGISINLQYENIKAPKRQYVPNEKTSEFQQERRDDDRGHYNKPITQNTSTPNTKTSVQKEEKQLPPKDDIIIEKEIKGYKKYNDNEDNQGRYYKNDEYKRNKEQYSDDYQDNRNYYRKNDSSRRDNYQQKDERYYNDRRDQHNYSDEYYNSQYDYNRKEYNYDNRGNQGNNYYKQNDDYFYGNNYSDNYGNSYFNNRKNQQFNKVIEKELEDIPRETTKAISQQEQNKDELMRQSQTQQKGKLRNENKEKISSNKFDKLNRNTEQKFCNPETQPFDCNSMMRMNYYGNVPQMNVHPYAPQMSFPIRDEDIHEVLEYYFSIKNLNKDIFTREAMNEEGWISADSIVTFNKMKDMKVTPDKIESIISKIGSDIVEICRKGSQLFLRPKHYEEEIKNKIKPIQQIKEEKEAQMQKQKTFNQQMPHLNQIPMNPMNYYSLQQSGYYPMMNMNMYMQPRPPGVANPNQIQYAQYYQKNQ